MCCTSSSSLFFFGFHVLFLLSHKADSLVLVFKTWRGVFVQRSWIKKPSSNPKPNQKKRTRDFYLGGRHHGARGAEGHSQRHWLSKRFRWRLPWRPHREREACSSIGRGATGPPSAGPMLPARLRRRRPRGSARGEPTRSPSPQARGLMGPQPQDQTSRWRPPAGAEPPPW